MASFKGKVPAQLTLKYKDPSYFIWALLKRSKGMVESLVRQDDQDPNVADIDVT